MRHVTPQLTNVHLDNQVTSETYKYALVEASSSRGLCITEPKHDILEEDQLVVLTTSLPYINIPGFTALQPYTLRDRPVRGAIFKRNATSLVTRQPCRPQNSPSEMISAILLIIISIFRTYPLRLPHQQEPPVTPENPTPKLTLSTSPPHPRCHPRRLRSRPPNQYPALHPRRLPRPHPRLLHNVRLLQKARRRRTRRARRAAGAVGL